MEFSTNQTDKLAIILIMIMVPPLLFPLLLPVEKHSIVTN